MLNHITKMMAKLFSYAKAHKKISIVAILILTVLLYFFFIKGSSKQPQYQTGQVTRGTIISTVSESGQVLSANFVNVFTQASGQVSKIMVKDGDKVKKGDVIANIDFDQLGQQRNTQAWANYLQAQSTLNNAQSGEYSLQSTMFSKWNTFFNLATNSTYQNNDGSPNTTNRVLPQFTTAQDDWLAAEANYKNQQNVVTQAQANLQNTWVTYQLTSSQITAPMDGTITNLTIFPGIDISNTSSTTNSSNSNISSQQIAVIQNEQSPLATFNVAEVDINNVKLGQKATLTLDSVPGKTFTGKVVSVDRIGSITSGVTNYPIIIQFDTMVPEVLPNMAINASIITGTKDNVLLIPSSAIQNVSSQSTVRVLKNGTVTPVTVETGISSDTDTEIISGLTEGDTIVIGSIFTGSSAGASSASPFGRTIGGFGGGGGGVLRTGGGAGGGARGGN